ncbi:hypothetical protein [Chromobacterium violaceum]|uniref:hypothetical protein n=1 Tax=Chromobacterium violaceum TaxID=536 RepID=UPI0009DA25BD|nr:hypothetical protein [Chromobacterium violaceum]OQS30631.1 hypothetical protein B0T41_01430 [Chromobacterium violaceum]
MTTWDYRVIEFETAAAGEAEPHRWRAIHEVFYNDAGQPVAYGENPAIVLWEVAEGNNSPSSTLARMQMALSKPALRAEEFYK